MTTFMKRLLVTTCLAVTPVVATAATIEVNPLRGGGGAIHLVELTGAINKGDAVRFEQATKGLKGRVEVVLSSPGGQVAEAINIGIVARDRGFVTYVMKGDECASSCSLIWLGGKRRVMQEGSRLGFHAASISTSDPSISAEGNAAVGYYLAALADVPYSAVTHITSTAPTDMRWLNHQQLSDLGIEAEQATLSVADTFAAALVKILKAIPTPVGKQ